MIGLHSDKYNYISKAKTPKICYMFTLHPALFDYANDSCPSLFTPRLPVGYTY